MRRMQDEGHKGGERLDVHAGAREGELGQIGTLVDGMEDNGGVGGANVTPEAPAAANESGHEGPNSSTTQKAAYPSQRLMSVW